MKAPRDTPQWIIDSIGAEAFERLTKQLTGSELQSLLLEVLHARSHARSPAEVRAQYARDGFVRPAVIDQRVSTDLDGHLLAAAEGFEAIELSPVAPLATCTSVAVTDQHRVLSALRGTEVVSDPTNVLALECAARLATDRGPAHLCTSQRVVRAQPVPKGPGYAPHFRLFVLASGGLETKDHAFTADTLALHIRTMLRALDRLEQHGYAFPERSVTLLATEPRAHVADRIAEGLGPVPVKRELLEHRYYSGLRFQISCGGSSIIDGGAFDWLATLCSNRKAVFIASGTGAQLIALRFRVRDPE